MFYAEAKSMFYASSVFKFEDLISLNRLLDRLSPGDHICIQELKLDIEAKEVDEWREFFKNRAVELLSGLRYVSIMIAVPMVSFGPFVPSVRLRINSSSSFPMLRQAKYGFICDKGPYTYWEEDIVKSVQRMREAYRWNTLVRITPPGRVHLLPFNFF